MSANLYARCDCGTVFSKVGSQSCACHPGDGIIIKPEPNVSCAECACARVRKAAAAYVSPMVTEGTVGPSAEQERLRREMLEQGGKGK